MDKASQINLLKPQIVEVKNKNIGRGRTSWTIEMKTPIYHTLLHLRRYARKPRMGVSTGTLASLPGYLVIHNTTSSRTLLQKRRKPVRTAGKPFQIISPTWVRWFQLVQVQKESLKLYSYHVMPVIF